MEVREIIDVSGFGHTSLTTKVSSGDLVTGQGQWAFTGNVLTWWDFSMNMAETLTLRFAPGAAGVSLKTDHSFEITNIVTVTLAAPATVPEGGAIIYTASVSGTPALSPVTVALSNGQTIIIAAGQTSGSVTVVAPADVYAAPLPAQVVAIASVTGTGGFASLVPDLTPVSTAVSNVTDITTVTLSATPSVAEGGLITYTASLGANPSHSTFAVNLDNGLQIVMAAGQTSGSVTVAVPADVYAGTPAAQVVRIANIAGKPSSS
jgi:hypothetical protein